MNELEKTIEMQGNAIIKAVKDDFDVSEDIISKEMTRFQIKYGKKWFKHYVRACKRLAEKENNKLRLKK